MITKLTHTAVFVEDQEEALEWYTEKLGFVKRADSPMGESARWLTIGPPDDDSIEIILESPSWGPEGSVEDRKAQIGKGPGFVFAVDDCRQTYKTLSDRGVQFAGEPEEVPWGVQAIMMDLYGNTHVLVEASED